MINKDKLALMKKDAILVNTSRAVLVDTDAIARTITGPSGAAMLEIEHAFGGSVVDQHGALNRAGMRELAFGDPHTRRKLESILHPLIGAEALRQADQAASEEGHEDREANDRGQPLASLSDLFFSELRLSSRA